MRESWGPARAWFSLSWQSAGLLAGWLAVLLLGLGSVAIGEEVGWLLVALAVSGVVLWSAPLFQLAAWLIVAIVLGGAAVAGSPLALLGVVLALFLSGLAVWPEAGWRHLLAVAPVEANSPPEASLTPAVPADPFEGQAGVAIKTIGGLRIRCNGADITARLTEKKLLAYVWLYLMTRHLAGQRTSLRRPALAGELSPGRETKEHLPRLRKILFELQRNIPPELAAFLRIDAETVDFVIPDDAAIDVEALRRLALESRGSHFEGPLVAVSESWLRRWAGAEYLPDFELLEEDALVGGPASELVVSLREEVRTLLADLTVAVAEQQLSRREPLSAISLLEPLAEEGRDDIDRLLVQACMEAGQTSRAAALRRRRPTSVEV